MKRVRIDSQKEVAARLAKLWGSSVSPSTVSHYAHPDREDRLPLEWDPIGISWIYLDALEKWAARNEKGATPAAKRKRSKSRAKR